MEAASRSEPPSVEESAQEKRGMKRTRETGDEDDEKRAAPKTMRKKQKQLDHASSEEISESMSVSRLTVTAKKGDKTKGKGKEKEPEEPSEAGGRRRRGKAAENLIERIAEEEADALPTDAVSQGTALLHLVHLLSALTAFFRDPRGARICRGGFAVADSQ